jgi:hypothetical protein
MRSLVRFSAVCCVLLATSMARSEDTQIPSWIPSLPDSKPKVVNVKKIENGEEVILNFNTAKTPAELKEFYQKGFEAGGFKDLKMDSIDDDGVKTENLKANDEKRYWWVSTRREKDAKETIVSIVYQVKN